MIRLFLRAKHWHIFFAVIGIPVGFLVSVVWVLVHKIFENAENLDAVHLREYFLALPFIVTFFVLVFFSWLWSIGVGLQEKIPASARMKTMLFKVFIIVPSLYIIAFSFTFTAVVDGIINESSDDSWMTNPEFIDEYIFTVIGYIALTMLLQLLSIVGIIYCLFFVAKTIKTAELQRETTFGDFVTAFFMLWFFPIGIWFLQPAINTLVGVPSGRRDDNLGRYMK